MVSLDRHDFLCLSRALQIDGIALIHDLVKRNKAIWSSGPLRFKDQWISAITFRLFKPDVSAIDFRHRYIDIARSRTLTSIDHGSRQPLIAHARGENERAVHRCLDL